MSKPNLELTTGDKRALLLFKEYVKKHGRTPTYRAFAALLGSPHPHAAQYYVRRLELKGYLFAPDVAPAARTGIRLRLTPKAERVKK